MHQHELATTSVYSKKPQASRAPLCCEELKWDLYLGNVHEAVAIGWHGDIKGCQKYKTSIRIVMKYTVLQQSITYEYLKEGNQ